MTKSTRKVRRARRGTYSPVASRERWRCATLSRAHFRVRKWNFLSLLRRRGGAIALRDVCSTEGQTRDGPTRSWKLRSHPPPLPLSSLHFPAAFAKKRIKSGNEGCEAPGGFLPRQSPSAGSFALSLWAGWARNSRDSACQPFEAECP